MIVAQQKFLKEIFVELPKFCPEPHRVGGATPYRAMPWYGVAF